MHYARAQEVSVTCTFVFILVVYIYVVVYACISTKKLLNIESSSHRSHVDGGEIRVGSVAVLRMWRVSRRCNM